MKLKLLSGKSIDVLRVVKGGMMDYLHIYIDGITPAEMYDIFDHNPEETEILTVIENSGDEEITHTYIGYTELYAVQKPFLKSPEGTWMVWMQRPTEVISDVA